MHHLCGNVCSTKMFRNPKSKIQYSQKEPFYRKKKSLKPWFVIAHPPEKNLRVERKNVWKFSNKQKKCHYHVRLKEFLLVQNWLFFFWHRKEFSSLVYNFSKIFCRSFRQLNFYICIKLFNGNLIQEHPADTLCPLS